MSRRKSRTETQNSEFEHLRNYRGNRLSQGRARGSKGLGASQGMETDRSSPEGAQVAPAQHKQPLTAFQAGHPTPSHQAWSLSTVPGVSPEHWCAKKKSFCKTLRLGVRAIA